jgi:hypothetical protein
MTALLHSYLGRQKGDRLVQCVGHTIAIQWQTLEGIKWRTEGGGSTRLAGQSSIGLHRGFFGPLW